MPQCAFKSCENNHRNSKISEGVSFFRFPTDPLRCAEWVSIVSKERREDHYRPCKNSTICSIHFDEVDITGNNQRRRLGKTAIPKLQTDNDSRDVDQTAVTNVPMQDDTAEDNELSKTEKIEDKKIEEDSAKTSAVNKDPTKCLCGSVLETIMKNKWEKDVKSYKTRLMIKNRKINSLQKINARLRKRNIILQNILKQIKKKKYVEPSVLRQISCDVKREPINQLDLLEIKEEKIQYVEPSPTREAEKDPVQIQVYGHNFVEDPIPIKLEVIDDSENYPDGSNVSTENTAGNERENLFAPRTIISHTDSENMFSFNMLPIDRSMAVDTETNLLNKLTNVLDEYDKWALKISKQIKSMSNVDEKINAMNATQSLVDAYLAKDAKMSVNTAILKSDDSDFETLLKPKTKTFVPSMLPVMGGILIPQQRTSHEALPPQTVQIQPITLPPNLYLIQTKKESNKTNKS